MRKIIITVTLLLGTLFAQSQINLVRYNDNFNHLKNDTVYKKGFEKIKYIHLYKTINISFGGELREQFQYYHNQNFGDVPPTFTKVSTGQYWHRVMAHTNIELGSKLRIFAQLGSTFRFINHNPLTPEIDENQLSLHQAFIDYRFQKKWMVRVGRQEISYGNHRLITFREGPNTRLAFDAAVIKYHSEKRRIDIFALTPVTSRQGIFDDKSLEDVILGLYATNNIVPNKFLLDYYFLNFNSNRRYYNFAAGVENRQSYGVRIFSQKPTLNYELEATYQSGKFNQLNISAYGISADVNYKFVSRHNLIIGFGSNYMSGDKNKNDHQLNTFNSIFSKPPFGLIAPIGLSNIVNINPYFKINPTQKWNVYAGVYRMWRQSNQDGTYSPGAGGAVETRPNPRLLFASTKKQIGTLLVMEGSYFVNNHLSFGFDASYFFAGQYVKETGVGKDITYYSFKGSYKF